MRIVHAMSTVAHGPLCYNDLVGGGRGVTGSEQSLLYLAKAQAEAGHTVIVYCPTDTPGWHSGVQVIDHRESWPRYRHADDADVAISWLSADFLRRIGSKPLRIHSLQINDWLLSTVDYHEHVDAYVYVSNAHRAHLQKDHGYHGRDEQAEILPNGVDLTRFVDSPPRKRYKCVYLSSPDRGLHWLLSMWPEIRFAHPEAELHVFYEVQKWMDNTVRVNNEIGNRAMYVGNKLNQLHGHGVQLRGALPPTTLAADLLDAELMLYPCDTVRFTEGFGVAVLESCAAGVVPVITDTDALGEIYAGSGAVIVPRSDTRRWTDNYLEAVLKLMENPDEIKDRSERVREFAKQYSWQIVAKQWDLMITRRREMKNA